MREASCSANSEAPLAIPASAAAASGLALAEDWAWRLAGVGSVEAAELSEVPLGTGVGPEDGDEPAAAPVLAVVEAKVLRGTRGSVAAAAEAAEGSRTERRGGKKRRSENRERIERAERSVAARAVMAASLFSPSSSDHGSFGLAASFASPSRSSSSPLSSSLWHAKYEVRAIAVAKGVANKPTYQYHRAF